MLFRIVKINFIKEKNVITLTCESISSYVFVIEIVDLHSEIAFEILDKSKTTELINEIQTRFESFKTSKSEWKQIAHFNRETSQIETCNAFVISWTGNNALTHREHTLMSLGSMFRNRESEFRVHGLQNDPVELMISNIYPFIHHYFHIDDKHVIDSRAVIPFDFGDLIHLNRTPPDYKYRWYLIDMVKKKNGATDVVIHYSDGPSVTLELANLVGTNSLGKALYTMLVSTRQYSVGFVPCKQRLSALLAKDPYVNKIFTHTIVIDKHNMPFFMELSDFSKETLEKKIIPYSSRLADLTNLPLNVVMGCNTGAKLIDVYLACYMSALHDVWIPYFSRSDISAYNKKTLQGGYITNPQREILKHTRLVDLDFKAFYPSIISEFNLDFKWTDSKSARSILPVIVEKFLKMRNQVSVKEGIVLKFIINNLYGTLGFTQSRFYCHEIASSITEIGRVQLRDHAMPIVTRNPRFRIIFAQTDGLLVQYTDNTRSEEEYMKDVADVCRDINNRYTFMSIHPAAHYQNAFVFATNKYISHHHGGIIKIKGIQPVFKSSFAILKMITEVFVSVMIDDALYPVGHKIPNLFRQVKRVIAEHKNNAEVWVSHFKVDKLYTRAHIADEHPYIKVAVDSKALPGETVDWLYVARKNSAVSDASPSIYTRITATSKQKYDLGGYDLNIFPYIPTIVKCLQYLCGLYTEEPSYEINEATFINDFHPLVHVFTEKRIRESASSSFAFSQKLICKYCKKLVDYRGFSHIINLLVKTPDHASHITAADLEQSCPHCHVPIKFWEHISTTTVNHLNVCSMQLYSSVFTLLSIARPRCKPCHEVIKKYKNDNISALHIHEQRMNHYSKASLPDVVTESNHTRIKRMRIF